MSLPNTLVFVPFDILTAAELNDMVENDEALADGTAIDTSVITLSKLAPIPYKFSVYRTAALNTANNAYAVVAFDTKVYDTGTNVDVVTNKGRFTAPVAGYYQFSGSVNIVAGGSLTVIATLYKNGVEVKRGNQITFSTGSFQALVNPPPILLAAADYVEMAVYSSVTSGFTVGATTCYFGGYIVSK
jgi:C1q domain-containing protein